MSFAKLRGTLRAAGNAGKLKIVRDKGRVRSDSDCRRRKSFPLTTTVTAVVMSRDVVRGDCRDTECCLECQNSNQSDVGKQGEVAGGGIISFDNDRTTVVISRTTTSIPLSAPVGCC